MANKDLHYIITLLAIGPSAKFSELCFCSNAKIGDKIKIYNSKSSIRSAHL